MTVCGRDDVRTVTDYQPFDAVRANFEAFADTIGGQSAYRFTSEQLIHNIAVFETILKSAAAGQAVAVV